MKNQQTVIFLSLKMDDANTHPITVTTENEPKIKHFITSSQAH